MNRDDDPHLWDLLGQAQKPESSPFFARNVVRAVRQAPPQEHSWVNWVGWRRVVPAISLVAAALLTFTGVQVWHNRSAGPRDNRMLVADGSDPDLTADMEVLATDDDDDSVVL